MSVITCKNCLIPSNFPGVYFDKNRICNLCNASVVPENIKKHKHMLFQLMGKEIEKRKQKEGYDCVVAYSGGKDSTYTLKLLIEEFGLKCLAVTVDNGFLSKLAIENGNRITDKLGVDYLINKPSNSFMLNMYNKSVKDEKIHSKASIKRASSICNSCINLINNIMIKIALEKNIPMIAGGYHRNIFF